MGENKFSRRDFIRSALASCAGLADLSFIGNAFSQEFDSVAGENVAKNTPMDEGRPSVTAFSAGMHRAAHQILDEPKIFDDPMALTILGGQGKTWLFSHLERFQARRSMRAFIVLRSRYAEDELTRAVQRGVKQYVILGAGLDTFPYRNPYPGSRLRVYEVDHPATQAWKRRRLQGMGMAIPGSLTFAPVDFEKQTLNEGLRQAGFNKKEPAYFSLLGVVIYLTRAAALETFKYVASLPRGTEIVFDCGVSDSLLTEYKRLVREKRASQMMKIGEPWLTYFDPVALANDLRQIGFSRVGDLGSAAANERYFKDREDGLRVSGGGLLIKARV